MNNLKLLPAEKPKTIVSYFLNVTEKTKHKYISLGGMLSHIKNGTWKKHIRECRKLLNDKEAFELKKKLLPAFTPSVKCSSRAGDVKFEDKFVCYNWLTVLDFDDLDAESLESISLKLREDNYVHFFFVSPSGSGLKVGVKVKPLQCQILSEENLKNMHRGLIFNSLNQYFKENYELNADTHCKDLFRVCYISYDPELYYNTESQEFVVNYNQVQSSVENKGKVKRKKASVVSTTDSIQGVKEGERNSKCYLYAKNLRDKGMSDGEVTHLVLTFASKCTPPLSSDEALRCIENSKTPIPDITDDHRTIITLTSNNRSEVVTKCLDALKLNGNLYVCNGKLVEVNNGKIVNITLDGLRYRLDGIVVLAVSRKGKVKTINCPIDIAKIVQAVALENTIGFPKLEGMVSSPVLRADLSVFNTTGYDDETGYYFYSEHTYTINTNPSEKDMRTAFVTLWKPFYKYPFSKEFKASKANLLCALFCSITLPLLNTRPAFAITSPYASSGKTMLGQCISYLVEEKHSTKVFPKNDDELLKQIVTVLIANSKTILWDNIDGMLKSPTLCNILTSEIPENRMLNLNMDIVKRYQVVTILTGKNIVISEDLYRRILRIVIDPDTDEVRDYKFNPLTVVMNNRAKIISAMYTLFFGYKNAGLVKLGSSTIASFEKFDAYNRQLVLWLKVKLKEWGINSVEIHDPLESILENKQESNETSGDGYFVSSLWKVFGENMEFSANDVYNERETHHELKDSLSSVFGSDQYINALKIGKYLQVSIRNRIFVEYDRDNKPYTLQVVKSKLKRSKAWYTVVRKRKYSKK